MNPVSRIKVIVSVLSITCVLYLLAGVSYIRPGGGDFAAGMLGGTVTGLIVGNAVANNNKSYRGRRNASKDICKHGHAFGCECKRCERHQCNS